MELSSCPQCSAKRNIPLSFSFFSDKPVPSGPFLQPLRCEICAHDAAAYRTAGFGAGTRNHAWAALCSCFEACKYSFQDRSLRSAALPAVRTPASVRAGALASASCAAVETAGRQRGVPPRTFCLLFYHFFCEPHIGDPAGRLPVRPGSPARIFPLIAAPTPAKHCSPLY